MYLETFNHEVAFRYKCLRNTETICLQNFSYTLFLVCVLCPCMHMYYVDNILEMPKMYLQWMLAGQILHICCLINRVLKLHERATLLGREADVSG